jgi:hypothetical protein
MGFKEEQSQIEDGILASLDRLSQFEEKIGKSLREKPLSKSGSIFVADAAHPIKSTGKEPSLDETAAGESPAKEPVRSLQAAAQQVSQKITAQQGIQGAVSAGKTADDGSFIDKKICFEIHEDETEGDLMDPLSNMLDEELDDTGSLPANDGELDIF